MESCTPVSVVAQGIQRHSPISTADERTPYQKLFGFFVERVLEAVFAMLLKLKTVLDLLFIFMSVMRNSLAFGALELDEIVL